jgi:hypothetical protein
MVTPAVFMVIPAVFIGNTPACPRTCTPVGSVAPVYRNHYNNTGHQQTLQPEFHVVFRGVSVVFRGVSVVFRGVSVAFGARIQDAIHR